MTTLFRHCSRRLRRCLLAGMACFALPAAWADGGHPPRGADHVPGEIVVKYREAATAARARVAGVVARPVPHDHGLQRLRLPEGVSVDEALARYRQDPAVLYAEPVFIARKTLVPDDPRYAEQWALPRMRLPDAWEISTGDAGVVVAILDTGIDYDHPDLAANMWVNAAEASGTAGVDDDGNGFVDDIYGYAFGDTYRAPLADSELGPDGYAPGGGRDHPDPRDDDDADSHGTHVAGIVAAVGNNNTGVSGVTWRGRLMAVKVLHGPEGVGTSLDIAAGIRYAVDNGAKVINLSLGFSGYSQTLADAVQYADGKGVLVVSAAGNGIDGIGIDLTGRDEMPATLRIPNNLTVAATTRYEELADYSNYGRYVVDLGAPGSAILSTMSPIASQGLYATATGTSMAAPQVSGLAALVWAAYPAIGHYAVKARILNAVTPLPKLDDGVISGGRADAFAALTQGELPAVFDVTPVRLPAGGTVTIRGANFGAGEGGVDLDGEAMTVTRWDADGRLVEAQTPPCGSSGRIRVNGAGSGFPVELEQQPSVTIATPVAVSGRPYTVRLTARASDPNGQVMQYEWDTDGSGFGAPQAGNSTVVSFATPGSYTVRVRATDDCGYTASNARIVSIPAPPSSSSDPRCFIATAAWGSSLHPRVQVLRDFRDRYLMRSETGRVLVELYYRWSPPLAEAIRENPSLRRFTVAALTPVVAAAEWLMALSGEPAGDGGPVPAAPPPADVVPGELLLKFKESVSEQRRQALLAEQGAQLIRRRTPNLYHLRLPEGTDARRVIEWFAARPEVEFAEPNYRARKMAE